MAIICPIFKKGDSTEVEYYRRIATDIIGEYLSGFIRRKSITNHIFTIYSTSHGDIQ